MMMMRVKSKRDKMTTDPLNWSSISNWLYLVHLSDRDMAPLVWIHRPLLLPTLLTTSASLINVHLFFLSPPPPNPYIGGHYNSISSSGKRRRRRSCFSSSSSVFFGCLPRQFIIHTLSDGSLVMPVSSKTTT